jgi:hypothetical protein
MCSSGWSAALRLDFDCRRRLPFRGLVMSSCRASLIATHGMGLRFARGRLINPARAHSRRSRKSRDLRELVSDAGLPADRELDDAVQLLKMARIVNIEKRFRCTN